MITFMCTFTTNILYFVLLKCLCTKEIAKTFVFKRVFNIPDLICMYTCYSRYLHSIEVSVLDLMRNGSFIFN